LELVSHFQHCQPKMIPCHPLDTRLLRIGSSKSLEFVSNVKMQGMQRTYRSHFKVRDRIVAGVLVVADGSLHPPRKPVAKQSSTKRKERTIDTVQDICRFPAQLASARQETPEKELEEFNR
jgi:hypothetical protein